MLRPLALLRPLSTAAKRGVTAIEFALIAPVLFLLMIGTVEMALVLVTHHMMENAAFNAARLAKTGYTDTGKTQLDTVQSEALNELGGLQPLIDVSKVTMSTTSYGSLSAAASGTSGSTGLGTAQEVLVFKINYPWTFLTPLIGKMLGDTNGQILLSSSIVVRNEPYD